MADTLQALLQKRMSDSSVAVKHGDLQWSWSQYLAKSAAQAAALLAAADPQRPMHIGALLGNTPEMLTQMAAAGLGGYVLCGLNTTRRGAALAADIQRADCQFVVTDAEHRPLLDGLDLAGTQVFDTSTPQWEEFVGGAGELVPHRHVTAMDAFMMIFTSGTSGNPKAVPVSHLMAAIAGLGLTERFALTEQDTCCVSMPLFHSNAVVAGWAPGVVSGAAIVPAKFSARNFLDDIRRYGATYMNYVGKPLAYVLATAERMRHGMYWSGDLAYRDAEGWIYLAGRTADWMRVDGENLAAAPIERLLLRYSAINRVAVYAVPDGHVGDQVMAAIVLNEGRTLDPDSFEAFLNAQPDLSPKARPRYVRIAADLPSTATHKVLKRQLIAQGTATAEGETLWEREPRGTAYRVASETPSPWVPDGGSAPSTVAPA